MPYDKFSAVLAVVLLSGTADARRFAIACNGTGVMADTVTGRVIKHVSKLRTNVYVVDDVTKEVEHALEPRQQFEPVCDLANGGDRSVDVSPGLIQVSYTSDLSAKTYTTCSFDINRKTGAAKLELRIEFTKTEYNLNVWQMICLPTAIPTFQTEKNKF